MISRPVVASLLVGIALGIAGTIFAPRLLAPYLPRLIRGPVTTVEGEVVRKQRDGNRLLLTVVTVEGSILATFTKKATEVDLLVEQGDLLMLSLRRYEPFLHDPLIERVKKAKPTSRPEGGEPATVRPAAWRKIGHA